MKNAPLFRTLTRNHLLLLSMTTNLTPRAVEDQEFLVIIDHRIVDEVLPRQLLPIILVIAILIQKQVQHHLLVQVPYLRHDIAKAV
jgi:hypothetical protein